VPIPRKRGRGNRPGRRASECRGRPGVYLLREILATHRQLARKLAELEQKYDEQFKTVVDAIRELMAPLKKERKQIGLQR